MFDSVHDDVASSSVKPMCSDDLLLYFSYEDHYNDVTCHQAIATQYGQGVERRFDPMRKGIVACFSGQTHFEVGQGRHFEVGLGRNFEVGQGRHFEVGQGKHFEVGQGKHFEVGQGRQIKKIKKDMNVPKDSGDTISGYVFVSQE